MNRLLVVEDEVMTSDLLRRYFEIAGYEVLNALTGYEAIRMAVEYQPRIVILDIMLPDMDGYEVCRRLRANSQTDHIPIIFLTQKDERRDRLDGLRLGADDYITKPFDVEELRLRVHNIMGRLGSASFVDPRTSLPNIALIKERLPDLLRDPDNVFLDVEVQYLDAFGQQYGPVAANQVVRSAARLIRDVLHEVDADHYFIGHPRDDHFLLAVRHWAAGRVERDLPDRFSRQVIHFYDYPDQQRGWMEWGDGGVPFMAFRIRYISAAALRALITPRPPAPDPGISHDRDFREAPPAGSPPAQPRGRRVFEVRRPFTRRQPDEYS